MFTAYVLAHSGVDNPPRDLSDDEAAKFMARFEETVSAGPRTDLRLGSRGGYAIGWKSGDREFHLIARGGIVAVFNEAGVQQLFVDSKGMEGFLRSILKDEISALERLPSNLIPSVAT